MGYSTDFSGSIAITPEIKIEHRDYIRKFNETRRMQWNEHLLAQRPDPIREATGLPIGVDGEYFVNAEGMCGQEGMWGQKSDYVKDSNRAPGDQPSLWCQWTIDDYGELSWDGGEKFYDYVEWMEYLIAHFFEPWGYTLNGQIEWSGEERDDLGMILVENNIVTTQVGKIVYD